MRLSRKGIENIRRGLKRSWLDGAHRQRVGREIDADTIRKRALFDRKGTHFADINFGGGVFRAYWSTRGRSDQVDLFCDGVLVATCAPNRIFSELMK